MGLRVMNRDNVDINMRKCVLHHHPIHLFCSNFMGRTGSIVYKQLFGLLCKHYSHLMPTRHANTSFHSSMTLTIGEQGKR